jgi:YkoY family integral membrane protein
MWGLNWGDLPTILGTIATLVLLEGLLSADNALVLAVMVKHLPKLQQKRALRYGIGGAFLFRFVAVIFAYQLIQYWQIKLAGGLYLLALAIKHFLSGDEEPDDPEHPRVGRGLLATIVYVELADIAFSIDSILAAVALPHALQHNRAVALSIIYIGGVLGIIMMRLVAGIFLVLLNRYKGLAAGAYVLVGWIGLKLIGSGIHSAFHAPEVLLWELFLPGMSGGATEVAARGTPFMPWQTLVPHAIREFPWELYDWIFWLGMFLIVIGSVVLGPKPEVRRAAHPQ